MRDSSYQSNDADEPIVDRWQASIWDELDALRNENEELQADWSAMKEDRDALESELRSGRFHVEDDQFDLMLAVRDWFDRTVLGVPKDLRRRVDDLVIGAM